MSIPYFESYNGKRPIVERVSECRPDWTGTDPVPSHCVAALTRDAIKCWATGVKAEAQVATQALRVCCLTDHVEVNAAAHALADALGVEP